MTARQGILVALAGLALGCGGGSSPVDAGPTDKGGSTDAETVDVTTPPTTFYHLEASLADGTSFTVDRDLSHKNPSTIYAFGSTHIAPAVSLALTDTVYDPYMTLTINIGVVKGSPEHPIQCPGPGDYQFGDLAPAVDLFASDLQFRSTDPGSVGKLTVTKWTREPGEVFEGSFEGRLGFVTGQPDKYADVVGNFHFTLPDPAEGQ